MTRPVMQGMKATGINKDVLAGEVADDWWTDGRNVIFRNGETCRVPGEANYAGAGLCADVRFCWFVDLGAQQWWIYGGDSGVYVTDGVAHYNITPVGWLPIATKNFIYTVGDINALPFVNHPEVAPFWWNGNPASVMTKLPDWPASTQCRVMRSHKNFLVAMNINEPTGLHEGLIKWSSSADPGGVPSYWTVAADNDAGDLAIGTPGGPFIDGISVRDQFFVAKGNAIIVMQYIGGQFIFGERDVFPSTGLFAAGAWVEQGNLVWMVTGNGEIVRHDGTSIENILYGILQDYFQTVVNYEWPSSVFVYRDGELGQVVFCYPTGTSEACTEAISIEQESGRPGIRDLPGIYHAAQGILQPFINDWDSDSQSWDDDVTVWDEFASGYMPARILWAAGTNKLLQPGAAPTTIDIATGAAKPVVATVAKLDIDMDEFDYRKTISGMVPRVKGSPGDVIEFRIGGRDGDSMATDFSDPISWTIGVDDRVDFFLDGRLLSIGVQSTGGAEWQISSLRPLARRSGRW